MKRPKLGLAVMIGWLAAIPAWGGPRQGMHVIEPDRILMSHRDAVSALAFFPDSVRAVSGSYDRTIKVWDVKEGRLLKTLKGHEGPVFCVAVSPDGHYIASASGDLTVRVWDVASGDLLAMLEGHAGKVTGVAFTAGGKQLVSGGYDGLRCWDWEQEKLLWKSQHPKLQTAVAAMQVTPDGKRAAVLSPAEGDLQVWDLEKGRLIVSFDGNARWFDGGTRLGVGITPDGKQAFGVAGDALNAFKRWDVERGVELPLTPEFTVYVEWMGWIGDGRRVLTNSMQNLAVYDTVTWERLCGLSDANYDGSGEMECSIAASPTGKTVLVGTGGFPREENRRPGKRNGVTVYTLPEIPVAVVPGPPEGKLSWEVMPAKVRTLAGKEVPLDKQVWPGGHFPGFGIPHALKIANGFDVIFDKTVLMIQSEPGVFREVINDASAEIADVVGDGQHAWVASPSRGILIVDRDGKTVQRVDIAEGLPPHRHKLLVRPLGSGKMLAAGVDKGEHYGAKGAGFLAVIEWDRATQPRVNVIFRENQLPDAWKDAAKQEIHTAMEPLWISVGQTRALVAYEGRGPLRQPMLRIDLPTLAVSGYNLTREDYKAKVLPGNLGFGEPPVWRSEREALHYDGQLYFQPLGDQFMNRSDQKQIGDRLDSMVYVAMVEQDGQLYLPSVRWRRVDLKTLEFEDLGPGIRMEGQLVDRMSGRNDSPLSYYVSGVLGGLAAVSKLDGCVLRISVDPAKPLPIRATGEPPPQGRDVPPGGFVRQLGEVLAFQTAEGAIEFRDGRLDLRYHVRSPFKDPSLQVDAEARRVAQLASRVKSDAGERARVGLTEAQAYHIGEKAAPVPVRDPRKVTALYEAYQAAAEGRAKDQAAQAVFAEAQTITRARRQANEQYLREMKALFSPRQWKLLNHQIPGAEDDATIPTLAPAPPPRTVAVSRQPGLTYDQRVNLWRYVAYGVAGLMIAAYLVVKGFSIVKKRSSSKA
jgi:hypothetical protein